MTLYAFSTENWKRPKKEIKFLFTLLKDFLFKKTNKLHKNGIKLKIIGNKKAFDNKVKGDRQSLVMGDELVTLMKEMIDAIGLDGKKYVDRRGYFRRFGLFELKRPVKVLAKPYEV